MTLDVDIHLVDSIDEVWALKQWMSEARPYIAVDTETEGLQWWRHRPRLLQVGDPYTAWVIPWDLWGGAIFEVLRDFHGKLVMHNAKFDMSMIEHWGGVKLPRSRIEDTRIMAHILDPTRSTGLKNLAEQHVDRMAAASQRMLTDGMRANGWDWDTVPLYWPVYWMYAGMDTILTARLYEKLRLEVMADAPTAYQWEMATQFTLLDMEIRGVGLDVDQTIERQKAFNAFIEEMDDWIYYWYGVRAGSDAEVIWRLQQDSVEWSEKTPTGRPRLDKFVLEDLVKKYKHPLAKAVLDRRRVLKLRSAYLDNFLKLQHNGRLHPSYNPASKKGGEDEGEGYGARTGRMSVADPSLQNLPRKSNDNKAANAVRDCIVASPGNVLVMSDFNQIEFRIMAYLSKDQNLRAAFDEGDFFLNLTREIWADPTIQRENTKRQHTKNAAYAKIYGAGTDKFAATAGIDPDEARKIMERLDYLYPGMKQWTEDIQRQAQKNGAGGGAPYVRSELTQRRFISEPGKEYRVVNYMIQGMAAEFLKLTNLKWNEAGIGDLVVLDVHDEIIADVPYDAIEETLPLIEAEMNDADRFDPVSITSETVFGERWGDKEAKEDFKRSFENLMGRPFMERIR